MILAVESSCDETAVAVVDEKARVLLDFKYSQISLHKEYGGVVPELASRSHFEVLKELEHAISGVGLSLSDLKSVAATMGPGLVGPLLVGSSFAQGLALGWAKPFVGVHHLRGHIASALLSARLDQCLTISERSERVFPAWVLLVSGGHCQLLSTDRELRCEILKTTSDDAAGECFDKCAKLMGLEYPGGPLVEKHAQSCTPAQLDQAAKWAEQLPRPKSAEGFSFAGLKTAFRLLLTELKFVPSSEMLAPLCRALEIAVSDSLLSVMKKSFEEAEVPPQNLICCGGVSANLFLRKKLESWCESRGVSLYLVPLGLSTDNAVMIALAAHLQNPSLSLKQVFARVKL